MADTEDLKSSSERSAGSSPAPGTILFLLFTSQSFVVWFVWFRFCMSKSMTSSEAVAFPIFFWALAIP